MASARIEQTLERFQEDERLTADLPDPAAAALLGWVEQQVQAADALADQQQFDRQVAAIRSAARAAASTRSVEPTAAAVVEQAQSELQAQTAQTTAAPATTPAAQPASQSAPDTAAPAAERPEAAAPEAAAAAPRSTSSTSIWRTLRRRVRRWTHRKAS